MYRWQQIVASQNGAYMYIYNAQKNLSSVENYLKCLNFDFTIIGLTETWFDDHNVHLYNIPCYKQEHYVRPTQGGGVSIMVAERVMYKRRTDLEICNENIETIFIEIDKKWVNTKRNIITGVIYRPPGKAWKISMKTLVKY